MAGRRLIPAVYKICSENRGSEFRESLRNSQVLAHSTKAPSFTIGFPSTETVAFVSEAPREKSDVFFPPGIYSLFPTATYTFPAAMTSWRKP